jgi:YHS domain-containing protein
MLTPVLRALAPASLALWVVIALPALADERINTTADDVAIDGYDTVAYFTDARALKGKPEFEQVWQGSRWWFTSAEHRDLFARDPERYAPQFGGFCTGGLSLGYLIEANPENWSIIDGRLYINHSQHGRDLVRADPGPVITAAEAAWARFGHGFAVGEGDGF